MYKYIYWFKRKIPQNYKPVVLITGCSTGIGLALCKLFHQQTQYRVVVTAREKSLHLLQGFEQDNRFMVHELDITSAASREKLVHDVLVYWGAIDILVNNAGISFRSVVEHMTEEDELLQMQTNYMGPISLIRLVLPFMRRKGRGKIINVSSVSGMLAMPTMASYSASKYALEGASEALWYEMRPFGIDVSLVQPGFIQSNSFKNVYYTGSARYSEKGFDPYSEFYKHMTPFVADRMAKSSTTPEKVAQLILDVIMTVRPPLWIPATFDAEFFYYLRRMLPRRLLHPFLYMCLPGASKWGQTHTNKKYNHLEQWIRKWKKFFAALAFWKKAPEPK